MVERLDRVFLFYMNDKFDHLKSFASEHFDDYLIVVIKDGNIYNTCKSKCSAYGMACMTLGDIQKAWNSNKDGL